MKSLLIFCVCTSFFFSEISSANQDPLIERQVRQLLDSELAVDDISDTRVWDMIQGGDIIGNGTGIAEIRFFESYYSLPSLLKRCLESTYCPLSQADKDILKIISEVLTENLKKRHQLLFISGKVYPRFFIDSDQIGPRTAKTGFKKGLPIFLNRDHFYKNGTPSIQIKEAIAILVHELGHQTGERSHTKLDGIGTRFATWATGKSYFIQTKVQERLAEFSVINPENPNKWPIAWISWDFYSVNLNKSIKDGAHCKDVSREPIGATLSNLHWRRESITPKETRISASAWVTLFCLGEDTLIYEEEHAVDIDLSIYIEKYKKESVNLRWN